MDDNFRNIKLFAQFIQVYTFFTFFLIFIICQLIAVWHCDKNADAMEEREKKRSFHTARQFR